MARSAFAGQFSFLPGGDIFCRDGFNHRHFHRNAQFGVEEGSVAGRARKPANPSRPWLDAIFIPIFKGMLRS